VIHILSTLVAATRRDPVAGFDAIRETGAVGASSA